MTSFQTPNQVHWADASLMTKSEQKEEDYLQIFTESFQECFRTFFGTPFSFPFMYIFFFIHYYHSLLLKAHPVFMHFMCLGDVKLMKCSDELKLGIQCIYEGFTRGFGKPTLGEQFNGLILTTTQGIPMPMIVIFVFTINIKLFFKRICFHVEKMALDNSGNYGSVLLHPLQAAFKKYYFISRVASSSIFCGYLDPFLNRIFDSVQKYSLVELVLLWHLLKVYFSSRGHSGRPKSLWMRLLGLHYVTIS